MDRALEIDGVYGSRMTGGGFGGCTVSMMRKEAVTQFRTGIAAEYERRFSVTPRIYDCVPVTRRRRDRRERDGGVQWARACVPPNPRSGEDDR